MNIQQKSLLAVQAHYNRRWKICIFFLKRARHCHFIKAFFFLALVNAGKVHLVLLMRVQRFPVLQVTAVRWVTTYLMTVCLRFCDSWAMINSPESQLLGRGRALLPRLPRDWGRLAQPGCPSFVIEPYCHPAKRGASPRTKCVCVRFCVCLCLRLCVCSQSDPRRTAKTLVTSHSGVQTHSNGAIKQK